ncbi:MAG: ADP-ribosylglycohydrolase family protein [Coriobacteriales bacterium]|nr:ADP-ribosylglycohydrolase family protein [Coriobacteriales bacterium]
MPINTHVGRERTLTECAPTSPSGKGYAPCVLEAINLGSDTDTTACVAGALAGAAYGIDAIPEAWREALRGADVLEATLF